MTDENLKIEQDVADVILNNGVRYNLGDEKITIRPLLFGTILTICRCVCNAGLTFKEIETGESDPISMMVKYGELVTRCVAIAEFGKKEDLQEDKINARAQWYEWNLTPFQIYELFVCVLKLGGVESFTNTISLLYLMKKNNLSPMIKGS